MLLVELVGDCLVECVVGIDEENFYGCFLCVGVSVVCVVIVELGKWCMICRFLILDQ